MAGQGETLGSPWPPHVKRPCWSHVMQTICVTVGAMGALCVAFLHWGLVVGWRSGLPRLPYPWGADGDWQPMVRRAWGLAVP
jgi:hypothetical protein